MGIGARMGGNQLLCIECEDVLRMDRVVWVWPGQARSLVFFTGSCGRVRRRGFRVLLLYTQRCDK